MYSGDPPEQKPETQFITTFENVQPAMQTINPGMQTIQPGIQYAHPLNNQQQVVYIPLQYSPDINYRNWSYLALGLGIAIYVMLSVIGVSSNSDSLVSLGGSACCSSFAIAAFMDAAFYKGKSDWQLSTGLPNGGSTTGMIFDIIFGVIAVICAIFALLGAFL
jgi:hypothetical protein